MCSPMTGPGWAGYVSRRLRTLIGDTLSKDATLATTKLSKTNLPGTISRAPTIDLPIARPANGQRPTRQHILPGFQMPYQPLATRGGLSTDGLAAPSAEPHNISARGGRVKLRAR
jgi:hypothetical protein